MRKRGFTADLDWLQKFVAIWKRHDIRARNPIAAKYIPKNYDVEGILGSEGAGALGCAQFMPATAALHLKDIGEPFDLWDTATAMKLMALETHRLGWRKDAPAATKIRVLLGWNQHSTWISGIVAKTEATRRTLASATGPVGSAVVVKREIALDLAREVPQGDGEKENLLLWARRNGQITLYPGQSWDFCAQTNATGWNGYRFAAGIAAGGVCFNASMLYDLAKADSRLRIEAWFPHRPTGWPRLTTSIDCPGQTLRVKNVSNETVVIGWKVETNRLSVGFK